MPVVGNYVIEYTVSLKVWGGQELGKEAAVCSRRSMYNDENNDVVLLVDTGNAFNSLGRKVFLYNISYICLANLFLLKTVTTLLQRNLLFEKKNLKSNESTDPVSMVVSCTGVTPLINMLIDIVVIFTECLVRMFAYAN